MNLRHELPIHEYACSLVICKLRHGISGSRYRDEADDGIIVLCPKDFPISLWHVLVIERRSDHVMRDPGISKQTFADPCFPTPIHSVVQSRATRLGRSDSRVLPPRIDSGVTPALVWKCPIDELVATVDDQGSSLSGFGSGDQESIEM